MKYFILAGGFGKRAEPLSGYKPKPAFPLAGVPLIARLLGQLQALGCSQGFVNLHHLGPQVREAAGGFPGVRFIEEKKLSGSRVLRQALPFFSEWLLAINGDTFLEVPLAAMAQRAAEPGVDGILLARRDESGRYAHLRCAGEDFVRAVPAAPAGEAGWMYAGAALFRKRAVAAIAEDNFFASMEKNRLCLKVMPYDGIWLDIGTPASYLQANLDFLARAGRGRQNALSPGARIDPAARVQDSVLWENSRVGPGAQLRECIVTSGVEVVAGAHCRRIISREAAVPLA